MVSDLDHFKRVNDTFGHNAGDRVLKTFASILKNNSRRSNMCARIGGEEFLMVLTHTSVEGAVIAVERIRETLAAEIFKLGSGETVVTASFGVAGLTDKSQDFDQLLCLADAALYSAKQLGRNRIQLAGDNNL